MNLFSYVAGDNTLNLSIPLRDATNIKNNKIENHLVVIEDIERFLQQGTSKIGGTFKHRTRRHLCFKCLYFFFGQKINFVKT